MQRPFVPGVVTGRRTGSCPGCHLSVWAAGEGAGHTWTPRTLETLLSEGNFHPMAQLPGGSRQHWSHLPPGHSWDPVWRIPLWEGVSPYPPLERANWMNISCAFKSKRMNKVSSSCAQLFLSMDNCSPGDCASCRMASCNNSLPATFSSHDSRRHVPEGQFGSFLNIFANNLFDALIPYAGWLSRVIQKKMEKTAFKLEQG